MDLSHSLDEGKLNVAIPLQKRPSVEPDGIVDPDRSQKVGENPLEVRSSRE
jgi:hypothetical protein